MTHSHDTATPALSVESEEALRPFANAVFNDNGDMTVTPVYDREAYVNAYFAHKRLTAPNPSPAAKGGDAVREALVEPLKWARTTDPSEGSVHYGTGVFGHWYAASRVKPKVWSVNHHIDGKNVIVGLFESLQSAYAAAQSDYDCRIRAALSTPTEGPASQTEGMGGDAEARRKRASELMAPLMELSEDELILLRHSLPVETLARLRATLTPPETVEAVPDDLTAVLVQGVQMLSAHIERFHDHEEETEEKVDIRGIKDHLEGAALVSVLGSIQTPSSQPTNAATASNPAPATDDRERLVEALRAADNGLAAMIRLSEMGLEESLREPEESGNFASFEQAKRCLATVRAALATEARR